VKALEYRYTVYFLQSLWGAQDLRFAPEKKIDLILFRSTINFAEWVEGVEEEELTPQLRIVESAEFHHYR